MKRIAVLGEIGSGNLGDDLGYVLVRDALLRAFDDLDVLADIRPVTPNLFSLLDGYCWDAVLTGCGTLLDLAGGPYVRMLLAASARGPVAIVGSGIADPRHVAPTAGGRAAFAELIAKAAHVWLRASPEGCDPALAAPDPGWLYGWRGDENPREGIGVNVGFAAFSTLRLDPEFLHTLDALRGASPRSSALVAAWRGDLAWLERLRRGEEPIHLVTGTRESTRVLGGWRAVVATRIHLAVLGACHGAMPILPDYAGKVRDVFAGTSVPHTIVSARPGVDELLQAIAAAPATPTGADAVRAAQAGAETQIAATAAALAQAWK